MNQDQYQRIIIFDSDLSRERRHGVCVHDGEGNNNLKSLKEKYNQQFENVSPVITRIPYYANQRRFILNQSNIVVLDVVARYILTYW